MLVLSQYVETGYALDLLADSAEGVGYLLKDRVADLDEFRGAVRRVAEGGSALDPTVVSQLVGRRRRDDPLDELTPREREVLELMAEGRSNAAIAERLFVTERAVEKHVTSIFSKLGLPPGAEDHRRVLAVLAYPARLGQAPHFRRCRTHLRSESFPEEEALPSFALISLLSLSLRSTGLPFANPGTFEPSDRLAALLARLHDIDQLEQEGVDARGRASEHRSEQRVPCGRVALDELADERRRPRVRLALRRRVDLLGEVLRDALVEVAGERGRDRRGAAPAGADVHELVDHVSHAVPALQRVDGVVPARERSAGVRVDVILGRGALLRPPRR